MITLTPSAARAARCRAQLFTAKDRAADPVSAVRHMLAMQAQNPKAARWAVGIRTKGTTYSDVQAALESGALVRTWPMRGTHHVMAAEDVSWLTGLCAHRARSGVEKRRAGLGLTLDDVLRAGTALVEATTNPDSLPDHVAEKAVPFVGPRGAAVALTRDGVRAYWETVGIDSSSSRGSHMLRFLCEERILVQGPPVGTADTFTAFEAWVPGVDDADADELLHRLVVKHLRGRGPAKVSDIAWWSGHTNATIKRAVDSAGDAVTDVEVAGQRHLMLAEDAEIAAANPKARPPRGPLLLPAFDEYLMGYGDRTLVLDKEAEPELFALIGPTINGLVNRAVMKAGRIVDTWDEGHPAASDYLKFAGR
ncbi:winged helix DNA-binding domain-containing protein [uncultured Corynebacterium sp.]|uniref:winged helix DNA-binding domain-containing protein n=1 Tax=uncultured Corynebacterium sp. TaxID=159447 RepID=UPI0025F86A86|nr:winged helix DNA-binding domain-containing protein [uncultured Corynebacterium sp.]